MKFMCNVIDRSVFIDLMILSEKLLNEIKYNIK